jgi:hypothetical protein
MDKTPISKEKDGVLALKEYFCHDFFQKDGPLFKLYCTIFGLYNTLNEFAKNPDSFDFKKYNFYDDTVLEIINLNLIGDSEKNLSDSQGY